MLSATRSYTPPALTQARPTEQILTDRYQFAISGIMAVNLCTYECSTSLRGVPLYLLGRGGSLGSGKSYAHVCFHKIVYALVVIARSTPTPDYSAQGLLKCKYTHMHTHTALHHRKSPGKHAAIHLTSLLQHSKYNLPIHAVSKNLWFSSRACRTYSVWNNIS